MEEHGIHQIELPLNGIMFYRIDMYGSRPYYILRDLKQRLYSLPYDPRLEHLVNGVYDIYRIADAWDVKLRIREDNRLPFTMLDHFIACTNKQEGLARDQYRDQQSAMKRERKFQKTPTHLPIEDEVIAMLVSFAETIPRPRAPQII
jgi:hypothetical protein